MKITGAGSYTGKHPWLYGTLVLMCLFFFGAGFFPGFSSYSVLLSVLMLGGFYLGFAEVFLLGLTCGLMLLLRGIGALSNLWPLPTVLALGIVLVAGKLVPLTRQAFGWMRMGELGCRQIVMIAAVAIISGIALISWYSLLKPDVSDIAGRIVPDVHPVALVLIGLLFSVSNAVCEEFVWRGMIFDALRKAFPSVTAVILIQALSFGMAHINGFPRGISGIFLATVYGCMMGYIRWNANGLLAPIAAHAFADAVIYSVLVSVVVGSGI